MITTTNLTFSEWSNVLIDVKLTKALLDRLTYYCHIVEICNDSYRFKQSTETAKDRIKAQETERQGFVIPETATF